ncbi:MAG: D-alanine--D-alanine ligase, partial [Frankiales bacterium]|nr:D-alanine--D-alanine ligase [Frankiales bacterium]
YALDCLAATEDPSAYEPLIAYVTPDGLWRFPADAGAASLQAARPFPLAEAVAMLQALRIDVMVPHMFCLPGMTSYRGLFDVLGIPYVGNPPAVMALTAHKPRAKAVVAAAGVRVPVGETLGPNDLPTLAVPAIVKPADGDNSLGLSLVRNVAGYPDALAAARSVSTDVLVESYVELGREVRCGVLERDGQLTPLPLEEYLVHSLDRPVRSAADKLARSSDGQLHLVAKTVDRAWIVDVEDPVTERVWKAALRCHRALGARHYSLFDFRIDPIGQPWFLEAGMYCSFAEKSVVAVMAAAAGIGVPELFRTTLAQALRPGIPGRLAAQPGPTTRRSTCT